MREAAILQACTDELAKIAFEVNKRRLAQAGTGAALGGLTTAAMYSPVSAMVAKKYGPAASAVFTALNTLRGAAVGGIVGGTLPAGSKVKKAAAWGQNVGRTHGWGTTSSGFATTFRSAGMQNPKPSTRAMPKLPGARVGGGGLGAMPKPTGERNNQRALRRGLSNVETPSG
jgi:hypothetical protein